MIKKRLEQHVKTLCLKNLKDPRVKCCALCPFQDDIEGTFPEAKNLFSAKQKDKLGKTPKRERVTKYVIIATTYSGGTFDAGEISIPSGGILDTPEEAKAFIRKNYDKYEGNICSYPVRMSLKRSPRCI